MAEIPTIPDPSCAANRIPRAGLLFVLLAAAASRLIGLGHLDPWMDEVYSHIASSELFPLLLRWETPGNESSSPLPFIEIKIARQIFGEHSALTLRVPSAVHGILAVGLLYIFVGRTIGWATAFWSALLLALHPFALEWGREGRMYTQWLSSSLLMGMLAHAAVQKARQSQLSPLDWRWWLLGMSLMLVHASNVGGTMSIAVTAAWLGMMGLTTGIRRPVEGWRILLGSKYYLWKAIGGMLSDIRGRCILLGSALAGAVYLGSWGLTGIAKMLLLLGHSSPAKGFTPPVFSEELAAFAQQLAGHPSMAAAALVWVVVAAGLALASRGGRWQVVALLVGLSLAGWLSFPNVAKSHFFAPRYVFTAVIAVSVGLGAVLAATWQYGRASFGNLAAATPVTLLLLLLGLWWPYLSDVFFVPKMAVRQSLAPMRQHAAEGDAFILVPDWYLSLQEYKPYDFGKKIRLTRGPKEARYDTGGDENFNGDFEKWFVGSPGEPAPPGKQPVPAATWLYLLRGEVKAADSELAKWEPRLVEIERVLAAYGLTKDDLRAKLTEETFTFSCRLSRDSAGKGVIDHIVAAPGRRIR